LPLDIVALSLPLLTGCNESPQAEPTAFDTLARWVPADAEQSFFLDLKPTGETGRYWQRIRQELEANPAAGEGLRALLHSFRIEEYGLEETILGPVVSGYGNSAEYVIAQVSDEVAAEELLRAHFEDVEWEKTEFEGKELYNGRNQDSYRNREYVAWALHDGLLFLSTKYDSKALSNLQALLSLAEEDSLAALASWQTLRDRLPEDAMGVVFTNLAAMARLQQPDTGDASLNRALNQQFEAFTMASVPEEEGMRVEIEGILALKDDAPQELEALFNLPAADPTTWTALPEDTALALFSHDASVIWPWLREMFNLADLDLVQATTGLDLEADLVGADGLLSTDFALGVTPPLPEQPISQGLPATQLLILVRDATADQAAELQAAMERRGAVFGPSEVEGVVLQTQVGTAATGYAISYGFDDELLFLGSSPDVIGQGIVARREDEGLVGTESFRSVMKRLPGRASIVVYIHSDPFLSTMEANTPTKMEPVPEWAWLEIFQAAGLGLRVDEHSLEGVIYFHLR
jgi:hypothetical protein